MKLEEKYKGNYLENIFFTESEIIEPNKVLGKVKSDSLLMNSNLKKVKNNLAKQAKRLGADAIMNFKYGQKRTILSIWDDTKWYGNGVAIKLNDQSGVSSRYG
jgi:uncharacterized protein YbjQ (UPF0145 family)